MFIKCIVYANLKNIEMILKPKTHYSVLFIKNIKYKNIKKSPVA